MLKCSRCRHIFPVPGKQRSKPRAKAKAEPPRPPSEQELSFSFEDPEWEESQGELPLDLAEESFSIDAADEQAPRSANTPAPALDLEEAGEDAEEDGEDEDEDGDEDEDEENARGGEADDEVQSAEAAGDDGAMSRRRASLRSVFLFFLAVVGIYYLVARALMSNYELTDRFVSALPLVGSSMAADRLLFRKVALTGVTGSYVRVKGGKDIFVVSGNATNTASHPLRSIQVQATLLDGTANELRSQVTTCGGILTERMLQDLTLRELEILRRVEPSKPLVLQPGESAPFAVVFADPPPTVAEYLSRVTAARRQL